ncbi:MAG: pilin [Candidatus Magasanikiibacteriota bacterium]
MKKIILILFIICSSLLITFNVQALDLGTGSGSLLENAKDNAQYATANETTFAETIGTVIKMVLSVVGVLFLAYMVYAGYLWMTAQGEEEQVKKSQTIIKQSIIGLIIMTSAYSITTFVVPKILDRTAGEPASAPVQSGSLVGCCFVIEEETDDGRFNIKKEASQVSTEDSCIDTILGLVKDCSQNMKSEYYSNKLDYDCEYVVVPAEQCNILPATP